MGKKPILYSAQLQENRIIMPFLPGFGKITPDREIIKRAKETAIREYPNAKKYRYIKPEFVKFKGKLRDESFWTKPAIEINN